MFTWTVAIKRHKVSQYCKSLPKLMLGVKKLVTSSFKRKIAWIFLACEQQTFLLCSSPLRDVLWGGTSATQQQKFHNDDVNQCLHNKSGSHGVPNANLINFMFLLVDFSKVLCSSANERQQNSNASREDYIPQILAVLLEIHGIYIIFWSLRSFVFCLLLVNNS